MQTVDVSDVQSFLLGLQQRITGAVADLDGHAFVSDHWQKEPGELLQGNGLTQILEQGNVFERAGCGFSHVRGPKLPPSATQHRPELAGAPFEAMGVSLVFHPRNPYVPTVHMNVRMLSAMPTDGSAAVCWFGGGLDLTPYYGFDEDAIHWHTQAKAAVQPFGDDLYSTFKAHCDQYFYLKHRNEPRGIGGTFFDDFNALGFEKSFALMRSVAEHFTSAYVPILKRRKEAPYGEPQRDWQLYRRGRYVEFNLVWDRGTLFGLQSKGRTEAILMSMPPEVRWQYMRTPVEGSPEHRLYTDFLIAKDWV